MCSQFECYEIFSPMTLSPKARQDDICCSNNHTCHSATPLSQYCFKLVVCTTVTMCPRSSNSVNNDAMKPFSVLAFTLVYPFVLARWIAVVQSHLGTAVRDDRLATSLGHAADTFSQLLRSSDTVALLALSSGVTGYVSEVLPKPLPLKMPCLQPIDADTSWSRLLWCRTDSNRCSC